MVRYFDNEKIINDWVCFCRYHGFLNIIAIWILCDSIYGTFKSLTSVIVTRSASKFAKFCDVHISLERYFHPTSRSVDFVQLDFMQYYRNGIFVYWSCMSLFYCCSNTATWYKKKNLQRKNIVEWEYREYEPERRSGLRWNRYWSVLWVCLISYIL